MSIDKSLKTSGALTRHRNVLRRAERISAMQDDGTWPAEASPFGLPKMAHRKAKVGAKGKKKAEAAAEVKTATAAASEEEKK